MITSTTEQTLPVNFQTLEEVEIAHIKAVLAATEKQEVAARILGIDPATLYRKRKRYNLTRKGLPKT